MCWSVPGRVKTLQGLNGSAEFGSVVRPVRFDLIEKIEIGDYVLVHAGYVIQKVDPEKAEFTIRFFKQKGEGNMGIPGDAD